MCRLLSFDDLSAQVDSSSRQSGLTRFGGDLRCATAMNFPEKPSPLHILAHISCQLQCFSAHAHMDLLRAIARLVCMTVSTVTLSCK